MRLWVYLKRMPMKLSEKINRILFMPEEDPYYPIYSLNMKKSPRKN